MNSKSITAIDFITQLGMADKNRTDAINTIRLELGNSLLDLEFVLPPDKWQQLHDHLAAIDTAASQMNTLSLDLIQNMTTFAMFAREMQNQRDGALYELHDALNRAEEAESTAQTNIYNRLVDNVQETLCCKRETADKIVGAFWDEFKPVDSRTAEMLDSIAHVVGEVGQS